jgi:NADH-quinone oxidoreductase subunit C
MDNEKLKSLIESWELNAEVTYEGIQQITAVVAPENLYALAEKLHSDKETQFDFLVCLSGVDYKEHMEVVYHLRNQETFSEIVLKAKIPSRTKPEVETVCTIWRAAEWHEREAFDLYGIVFLNHPDLRRILLDDDWVGYPLRKDYVDTVNIVSY